MLNALYHYILNSAKLAEKHKRAPTLGKPAGRPMYVEYWSLILGDLS